jgi:serine/threonine-protein kinase
MERSAAFEELQARDLKIRQREEPSSLVEANHVIVTEPPGGTVVEPGSFVLVILSTGEDVFTIPNVVDDTLETATARLEANGFVVGTVSAVHSDTVPAGVVIRQSPRGGSPADPGTTVDLDVSDGPFTTEMPDVTQLAVDNAVRALEDAGFDDIVQVEEFDDEMPEGFVIRTDPEAGETVPRESRVTLFVSKGTEPFELPDLVGMTVDQARDTVTDLGLVFVLLDDTTPVTAGSDLDGLVASQSPPGGSTIKIGDEVRVSIGELIQREVPDLIGLTQEEAATALAEVGLVLEVTGETEVDPESGLVGLVATQDPEDTVTVPDGSTVQITIGVAPPEPPPGDDGGGDDG